jgi:hypothetical protein
MTDYFFPPPGGRDANLPAVENNHPRRMAKKVSGAKSSVVGRESLEPKSSHGSTKSRPTAKLKPSSLLDTRVVDCGDNLESFFKRSHQVIGVRIGSGKCGSDQ